MIYKIGKLSQSYHILMPRTIIHYILVHT